MALAANRAGSASTLKSRPIADSTAMMSPSVDALMSILTGGSFANGGLTSVSRLICIYHPARSLPSGQETRSRLVEFAPRGEAARRSSDLFLRPDEPGATLPHRFAGEGAARCLSDPRGR